MSVHRDSVEYWKQQTAEGKAVPRQEVYLDYLDRLAIQPGMTLLDVGVGFGRFVPDYARQGARIYGIDIDPNMLESARAEYGERCEELKVAPAEDTGFADGQFDRVVCWAVFDELQQNQALLEISRVLATGGLAVLTGKNAEYELDDEEAYAAEKGCRAKNHPNHFTRYREIDFAAFGVEPVLQRFFRYRGDFATHRFSESMPPRFYEYLTILRKVGPASYTPQDVPSIAETYSRTFEQRQGQGE